MFPNPLSYLSRLHNDHFVLHILIRPTHFCHLKEVSGKKKKEKKAKKSKKSKKGKKKKRAEGGDGSSSEVSIIGLV